MRSPRAIYAATAVLLLLIGTVSVLVYRAIERDVVDAFAEQQLAVARTVAASLDGDARWLAASLRQLNALPSIQTNDVSYVGQRVQAAFSPDDSGIVVQVVRIDAAKRCYAWTMQGALIRDAVPTAPDRATWRWLADRAHAGELRVGHVWWDTSPPPQYRALTIPVWRVASSGPRQVPANDFNGVLAFVVDTRRMLAHYVRPASIESTRGTLSLHLGNASAKFHIGSLPPTPGAIERMQREREGTAVADGYVWAWSHLAFADKTWGVSIGTPYEVASARVGRSGLRQLALVGVLLTLVPAVAWLLVRRERASENERRLFQMQLAEAQKMDAVGKLAGGIAHDFNNLLTAILGYTTIILEDSEPGSPIREQATQVRRAAESAAALTQKLLAFGRRQVLNARRLDLTQLLNDIMPIVQRLVGEHIAVVPDLQADIWPVVADRVQVEQVIINLAVNARDAMPNGGTLEIIARNAPRPQGEGHAGRAVPPGDYVQIVVRDTGSGMNDAIKARMFEPFFTTKPKGRGTGLGLSSVWGIVNQSGGHVAVTSAPRAGTAIELLLPRAQNPASADMNDDIVSEDTSGNETILVVDDERGVRDFLRKALEREGYRALVAESGEDAIRVVAEFGGRIALLVTDVRMPGMQGPQLATRLREKQPSLPVLFISGYAAQGLSGEMLEGAALLKKPFTPAALMRAVRRALERGA